MSTNCNYRILFDVCCVLTVRNILYVFGNTQRDGLSQIYTTLNELSHLRSDISVLSLQTFLHFHQSDTRNERQNVGNSTGRTAGCWKRNSSLQKLHLHLRALPRLRMSGATPTISLYAFSASVGFNVALKTAPCRSGLHTLVCAYKNMEKWG